MNENLDQLKVVDLTDTEQSIDSKTLQSLKKVSEKIQKTIDTVDSYRTKVEGLQPPIVKDQPWYKFTFGKASVKEVNKVMKEFYEFVQHTFKMVATSQNSQNENDMNICRLIGCLAMAEANLYEQLSNIASEVNNLSTEDEDSAKKLKELEESFIQSVEDSTIDSAKKAEQMKRLLDYVTLFAESKTKKIRSISLTISEIKRKLDMYSSNQDEWIKKAKDVHNNLNDKSQRLEEIINKLKEKLNDLDKAYKELSCAIAEVRKKQDERINNLYASIKSLEMIINETMNEHKTIIESQNKTIEMLLNSIKDTNDRIKNSKVKVNIAIGIGITTVVFLMGIIGYMISQ